ncbi:hypothetical protein RB195_024472 [Necator americanus]|uniref:Uncharacterized protein n=1 Tax=Necator americanus TaxID=51031 RepID=A0ABR1ENF9_NECAM
MATSVLCDKKVSVRLKSKIYSGFAFCCPLRMRVLADDESLGKRVARYGDVDVEVEDMCNAKRQSIQRQLRGKFRCQNCSEARRFRREAAREAKDSLVGPCEAGYDRCAFVYG